MIPLLKRLLDIPYPNRCDCCYARIPHDRLMRADRAVDRIREKMGEQAVMRACFLSGPVRQMAGGLHASRRTGITKKIADPFPEETGPA